jgi:antitoxin (DNA-binding transcriptional repressor) of toxin-antitoxin stability system
MKTVSVRDLRYDFPKVEDMLRSGEEIRITKRKRVIARLTPGDDSRTRRPATAS